MMITKDDEIKILKKEIETLKKMKGVKLIN